MKYTKERYEDAKITGMILCKLSFLFLVQLPLVLALIEANAIVNSFILGLSIIIFLIGLSLLPVTFLLMLCHSELRLYNNLKGLR